MQEKHTTKLFILSYKDDGLEGDTPTSLITVLYMNTQLLHDAALNPDCNVIMCFF